MADVLHLPLARLLSTAGTRSAPAFAANAPHAQAVWVTSRSGLLRARISLAPSEPRLAALPARS